VVGVFFLKKFLPLKPTFKKRLAMIFRCTIITVSILFFTKPCLAQAEYWPRVAILTDIGGFTHGITNANLIVQWTPRRKGWKAETKLAYYYNNNIRDIDRYCIECQFDYTKPSFGVWQGFIKPQKSKERGRFLKGTRTTYWAFGIGVDRFHTLQKNGQSSYSLGGGPFNRPSGYLCDFSSSPTLVVNNFRFKTGIRIGRQFVSHGGLLRGLSLQLNLNYERHPYAEQFTKTEGRLAPPLFGFINSNLLFYSSTGTPFRSLFFNPEMQWTLGFGYLPRKKTAR
jgi:hypothetical protein